MLIGSLDSIVANNIVWRFPRSNFFVSRNPLKNLNLKYNSVKIQIAIPVIVACTQLLKYSPNSIITIATRKKLVFLDKDYEVIQTYCKGKEMINGTK